MTQDRRQFLGMASLGLPLLTPRQLNGPVEGPKVFAVIVGQSCIDGDENTALLDALRSRGLEILRVWDGVSDLTMILVRFDCSTADEAFEIRSAALADRWPFDDRDESTPQGGVREIEITTDA